MAVETRCERCGGNKFQADDHYGRYQSCLQCGRTNELASGGSLESILRELLGSATAAARQRKKS